MWARALAPAEAEMRRIDERVVAVAPTAEDGALMRSVLADAGVSCHLVSDLSALATALRVGAGVVLFTEEALPSESALGVLVDVLEAQPSWSEVPIFLLSSPSPRSAASQVVEQLGNVTVLERPIRLRTLVSALRSAIAARRRQYQVRDQLLALERGERQLNDIFENAPIGLHCVDARGTIVRVNQTALDMLGYDRDEYVGRAEADFHRDPAAAVSIADPRLADGCMEQREARLRCKDGTVKLVIMDSSALWEAGEFVYTRRFMRDVTRARAMEEALHESEQRLRVALQTARGGVFEHDFATDRTHWSPELEELYGGPGTIGDGGDLHGWVERVHPEDRERVRRGVRGALRSGEYIQDFRIVWPDGSIRWLHTRAGVVFGAGGRPARMLGVQLDVTESKRTEEARAFLAGIVESSEDAVITKSLDDSMTSWNRGAERLFGYRADEVIGRSVKMLIPPERHAEEDAIVPRLLRGERIDHFETLRITKDGRTIDISLTVSAIRDHHGAVVGVSKVARDITEKKAIERLLRASEVALREADQRKDEFLAMLAHELRNPLAPIRNVVGLLGAKPIAAPIVDRAHDILDRQVRQLSRLIDDLLDVARISRGQIPLEKETLSVAAIVEMAVETARPAIEQRGHSLMVELPRDPLAVEGDRARLVQVVGNLLMNAAKFTPSHGSVALAARRVGSEVEIVVSDNGVGIASNALSRVFELFAQEETSLARTHGGLGIGLTLVRDLVTLHGGRVELHSEGRGSGTVVRVHLPVANAAIEAPPAPAEARPATGLRILIAEDYGDTADSLRMLLERKGHEVCVAREGRSAVRLAAEFGPDVALLDIGLPDLDGYEVARQIRAQAAGAPITMIAISGYGREEDKRAAKEAGFDHHCTKPVDLRRLVTLFPRR